MLATPGALPGGPGWMFEPQWAGQRVLADVADRRLHLSDTAGADVTGVFPELACLAALGPDMLLDGVVVALAGGVPSHAALAGTGARATYVVFDVLRLYGVALLDRPFDQRRATLERLPLDGCPSLTRSPVYADGAALLAAAGDRGLPGLVAKRRESSYRPGARCPDWRRVAAAGWTAG